MEKDFFLREIEAHSGLMYRVAYTILQNDDACRDAMQDTALKAWEKRKTLREERFFRTWITRILLNACCDQRRRQTRVIPVETVPESVVSPPDPMLAIALQNLPEKLRLPLVLCCAEGMTYAEAAQALRLPEATVRGRIYRAKQQLRRELGTE